MSLSILDRCLDLFEQRYYPKILPDPKYASLLANQLERKEMVAAGKRFHADECSLLGNACMRGSYDRFLHVIKHANIANLNQYFETESRWSLLHFVMFGRKKLLMIERADLLDKHEHLQIAKYLLDRDLFVDIQSRWGYSALHESVLNFPDLEFSKFLLQNGADPNLKNIFGETPLMTTVMSASIESLKMLCDYGADPQISEEFHDWITPLRLARHHIEATAILNNAKRKLETNQKRLEHEDVSYCIVCNVSSKKQKLFKCERCKGPERYCGRACQGKDWPTHKNVCNSNRWKIKTGDASQKGLVFSVQSAQGLVHPYALNRTQNIEDVSEKCSQTGIEKHRKEYQKKRGRRVKKELSKSVKQKNKVRKNEKFVIKVQILYDTVAKDQMLVHDRNRKYCVYVAGKGQRKSYRRLFDVVEKDGEDGALGPACFAKKAYFYAWVDTNEKLHVLSDKVLALQPW